MKKRFSNNKGFSLVELIIVVAIMAVLIGILAPQYLKYVEKSRLQTDNDYIDSVRKACETVAADPSYNIPNGTYTISFSTSAAPKFSSDPTVDAVNSITLSGAIDDIASVTQSTDILKSKTYGGAATMPDIVLTISDSPTVVVNNLEQ